MSAAEPFLPVQPGEDIPVEETDAEPTEVEVEEDRADRADPQGDAEPERGTPPASPTTFHAPDGASIAPADL